MATAVREPDTGVGNDPLWGIEQNGINPIPDSERHGSPLELFWIWFAAAPSYAGVTWTCYFANSPASTWRPYAITMARSNSGTAF